MQSEASPIVATPTRAKGPRDAVIQNAKRNAGKDTRNGQPCKTPPPSKDGAQGGGCNS